MSSSTQIRVPSAGGDRSSWSQIRNPPGEALAGDQLFSGDHLWSVGPLNQKVTTMGCHRPVTQTSSDKTM